MNIDSIWGQDLGMDVMKLGEGTETKDRHFDVSIVVTEDIHKQKELKGV